MAKKSEIFKEEDNAFSNLSRLLQYYLRGEVNMPQWVYHIIVSIREQCLFEEGSLKLFRNMLETGYMIMDKDGKELSIKDLFKDFKIFMEAI